MFFETPGWDMALFKLLNQGLRHPVLDAALPWFSSVALIWGAALAGTALLGFRRGWKRAALMLVVLAAVGLADVSSWWIKDQVGRVRPVNSLAGTHYVEQEDAEWRTRPGDFAPETRWGSSYPSAHAANTMALAACAMLLIPGAGPWVLVLPLLTGWSRVYLGKHFPTDVLAGWLLGLAAALAVCVAWRLARNGRHDPGRTG